MEENTPETVLRKGMEYLARIDAELEEDRTELAELERKVEAMRKAIAEKHLQLDAQREDVEDLQNAMEVVENAKEVVLEMLSLSRTGRGV